ncbi:TPA: hypothetical protein ACF37V_004703 [Vibrio parahaemolyticus]
MLKRFVLSLAFLIMAAVVSFQVIFTVPEHPQIIRQTGSEIIEDIRCIEFSGAKALDDNGKLNLVLSQTFNVSVKIYPV